MKKKTKFICLALGVAALALLPFTAVSCGANPKATGTTNSTKQTNKQTSPEDNGSKTTASNKNSSPQNNDTNKNTVTSGSTKNSSASKTETNKPSVKPTLFQPVTNVQPISSNSSLNFQTTINVRKKVTTIAFGSLSFAKQQNQYYLLAKSSSTTNTFSNSSTDVIGIGLFNNGTQSKPFTLFSGTDHFSDVEKLMNDVPLSNGCVLVLYVSSTLQQTSWSNSTSSNNFQTNKYLYYQFNDGTWQMVQPVTTATATMNAGQISINGQTLPDTSLTISYNSHNYSVTADSQGKFTATFSAQYNPNSLVQIYPNQNAPTFVTLSSQAEIAKSFIALNGTPDAGQSFNFGMIGFNPMDMHLFFANYTNQFQYPTYSKPNLGVNFTSYAQNLNGNFMPWPGTNFLFKFTLCNANGGILSSITVNNNSKIETLANFINGLKFAYGDRIEIEDMQALNLSNNGLYSISVNYAGYIMAANNYTNLFWSPVTQTNNGGQYNQSGPIYYSGTISQNGITNTSSDCVDGNGVKKSMGNPSLNLSPNNYFHSVGKVSNDYYLPSYVTNLNFSSWKLVNATSNSEIQDSKNPSYDLEISGTKFFPEITKLMAGYNQADLQTSATADQTVLHNIFDFVCDHLKPNGSGTLKYTVNQLFNNYYPDSVCEGFSELLADMLSTAGLVTTIVTGHLNWGDIPTIYNTGCFDHAWDCVYLPATKQWQMVNPAYYTQNADNILYHYYNIVAIATLWNPSHPFQWYFGQNTSNMYYLQGTELNQYYNYTATTSANLDRIYQMINSIK